MKSFVSGCLGILLNSQICMMMVKKTMKRMNNESQKNSRFTFYLQQWQHSVNFGI